MTRRAEDSDSRLAWWLGVFVAAVLLLIQVGAVVNSDGATVYGLTVSLVKRHTFAIERSLGVKGEDSRYYSKYGPGLSLLAVVPYVAVKPLTAVSHHDERLEEGAVATLLPLLSAMLVVFLFKLARHLGGEVRSSILVAVGAVCCTFVLPYTKDFFSEPVVALLLVVAFDRALQYKALSASVALSAATFVRPQAFLVLPFLLWALWERDRWVAVRRASVPLAVTVALLGAYNFLRFGDVTNFGYDGESFTTPLRTSAVGFLFDPGKSVLLFAPIVVLLPLAFAHIWRRNRRAAVLLGANLVVMTVIAAKWDSWQGGWSWGPRLLITAIVPALPLLAPWIDRSRLRMTAAKGLFAAGLAVSAATVLVPTQAQQLDRPQPKLGPQVLRQFELIPRTIRYTSDHLYVGGAKTHGEHRRYLALWQVGAAREAGRPGLIAASALSILLVAAISVSLFRLRSVIRTAEAGTRPSAPGSVPTPRVTSP